MRKDKLSYIIILAFTAVCFLCSTTVDVFAQSTKIKGKVIDSETGEPIPFVNIFFTGTTIGVSTDLDGQYHLETYGKTGTELNAVVIGYESQKVLIKPNSFNEINFYLKPTTYSLSSVVIKADDHYVRSILQKIDDNRSKNDPEQLASFSCDIYSKMELDMTNINKSWKNKKMQKNFGFVFDYMDTSAVSGKAFLPVMISESNAKYYHSKDPSVKREIIKASRISGFENNYSFAQFTGHMHAKVNFYDNYIDVFNVKFASPLSGHGHMFYNYFIVDSTNIDGRKTYKIRFHPKMKSAPVLDGEIEIDSISMGMRSAHIKMAKDVNVNWLRDLVFDTEYSLIPNGKDSIWFHKQDKLYADFSITVSDSSKLMSFLGRRQIDYTNPEIGKPLPDEIIKQKTNVVFNESVLNNDPEYWQNVRPQKLSEREQNIYNMVDSIKRVPMYRDIYTMIKTIFAGYYETTYIGVGPYYKLFSFNNLEGARFQIGARTTSDLSKKARLTGYIAYGTKDDEFKGGGTLELNLGRQPTRKLTLSYKHDAIQLGKGDNAFSEGNFFSSIFSKGNNQRLSYINEGKIMYDHEFSDGINGNFSIETKNVTDSKYVPMYTPDSIRIKSITSSAIHLQGRFSWNESVQRGYFSKAYLYTDYPILYLDLSFAPKNIFGEDYEYFRIDGKIEYALSIPPIGTSYFDLSGGKIFGKVPYTLLKIHEGNGTYFFDPQAFACMEYYEFASDSWAQFFYSHNFKGFFLGKIPLLKRLKWREVVALRMAYGSLEKRNDGTNIVDKNGINPNIHNIQASMLFPKNMTTLHTPYIEMGVGVTNIFKIFRVDCFWRLTHRTREDGSKPTNFSVNFGFDFRF